MALRAHIVTGERQNKMFGGRLPCTVTDPCRAVISCASTAVHTYMCECFPILYPPVDISEHAISPPAGQKWDKMAEGSRDQASVSTTADPEEDSPNMIVYRKVRLMFWNSEKKLLLETSSALPFFPPLSSPPGGANVAPWVLLISPPSLSMRVCLTRGPISVEGNHPADASRLGCAVVGIPGRRSDRRDARYLPHPLAPLLPAQLTDGELSLR